MCLHFTLKATTVVSVNNNVRFTPGTVCTVTGVVVGQFSTASIV